MLPSFNYRYPSDRYEHTYPQPSDNSIHRDHAGRDSSPRPSYEETIYGVIPRHMKFSLQGALHARMESQGHGSELYSSMKYPLDTPDNFPVEYQYLQTQLDDKGEVGRSGSHLSDHFSGARYIENGGDRINIDLRGILDATEDSPKSDHREPSGLLKNKAFTFREKERSPSINGEGFRDLSKYPQYWPKSDNIHKKIYQHSYKYDKNIDSYKTSEKNHIILNEPEDKPSFTPYNGFKGNDKSFSHQINSPDVERSGHSEQNYYDTNSRKIYAGVLRIPVEKLKTHVQYSKNQGVNEIYKQQRYKPQGTSQSTRSSRSNHVTQKSIPRDHSSFSNMYIKNEVNNGGQNTIRAKSSWIDSTSYDPNEPYHQQQVISQRMYHDELPGHQVMEPVEVPHRMYNTDMATSQPHAPMMPMVLEESEMMTYKPQMEYVSQRTSYKPKVQVMEYKPDKLEMMSYKPEMMSYKPDTIIHKPVMMAYKPEEELHMVSYKPERTEEKPEMMAYRPMMVHKKPEMMVYKPVTMEKKPEMMVYKPVTMEKKPDMMVFKPVTMEKKPEMMAYKPITMENKPQMMIYKPVKVEDKPHMMSYKPVMIEKKPEPVKYQPVMMTYGPQMDEVKQESISHRYMPAVMMHDEESMMVNKPMMMAYESAVMEPKPDMVVHKPESMPDGMVMKNTKKKPYKTAIDIKKTDKGTIIDILHKANEAANTLTGYGYGSKRKGHTDNDELKLRMTMEKRGGHAVQSDVSQKMMGVYSDYKKTHSNPVYHNEKRPGYLGYKPSLVNMLMRKMSKRGPEMTSLLDNPSSYLQNSFNKMLDLDNHDSGRFNPERSRYYAKELMEDDVNENNGVEDSYNRNRNI